jgi:hypothetical protein
LELLVIQAGCAFVSIVVWPAFGAYLILSASPLIVGVARGSIPLRPNEMLLLLVMTALGIRIVLLMLSGRRDPHRFGRIDRALLLLVLTGSVMPVLCSLVRSQPLSTECVVSGEFSENIGLVVAVVAFALLFRGMVRWMLLRLFGAGAIVLISFWSVIARRLDGFGGRGGMPFGVRPAPRAPAPEKGGNSFMLRAAMTRTDAIAAAAAAGFCYLSALLALMLFDPHFTLRGSADLFFPLLALSLAPSLGRLRQYTPLLPSFIASSRPSTGYPSPKEGIIAATD